MSFLVEIPSIFTKATQIPTRLGNSMLTGNECIQGLLSVNGSVTLNANPVSDYANVVYYDSLDISNLNITGNFTMDELIISNTIATNNLDVSGSYIHSNNVAIINNNNVSDSENSSGIAVNSNFDLLNSTDRLNLIEWRNQDEQYAGISVKSYDGLKIGLDFKTLDESGYATKMSLDPDGKVECFALVETSDDRLKTEVKPITNAVETITKLTPQTYHKYNTMDGCGNYRFESGLIAQEIYHDVPELRHLVHTKSDSDNWGSTPASVNYIGLIPYCIQAVKEQQEMIHDQQKMIYEENEKYNNLLNRIQALEFT